MNDYILIAMPAWIYWLLAAYMVVDGVRIMVSLFNQYMQRRIDRSKT